MPPTLGVYIPTIGRVGLKTQITLQWLTEYSSQVPYLVCPPGEVKQHLKYHRKVVGCSARGIGPTRQWIMENANESIVVVASDDISFGCRPDPSIPKLILCKRLDPMFDAIRWCVASGFIHGAIGARQGNNHMVPDAKRCKLENNQIYTECDRANEVHYMLRKEVLKTGVRWDRLVVMEDFHYTLSMLTRGIPNRILHSYVWNQRASNGPGGCSLYRNAEVQTRSAMALQKAFPDYVKIVKKTSKTWWKGMEERTDVRVQWLRAYKSSQQCTEEA